MSLSVLLREEVSSLQVEDQCLDLRSHVWRYSIGFWVIRSLDWGGGGAFPGDHGTSPVSSLKTLQGRPCRTWCVTCLCQFPEGLWAFPWVACSALLKLGRT